MLMNLRRYADSGNRRSLANQLRAKRFALFERLSSVLPRPLRIIDIGGTTRFWELNGWAGNPDYHITTVNLEPENKQYENIIPRQGDARDLREFEKGSFDIAFSNSVIEHLYTYENQAAMAREVRRVGKAYWVQTPNYWFLVEPHFHVPGWQWLPREWRVRLIRRFRVGWRGPCPDRRNAERTVNEIRLLTASELQTLFSDAVLIPERFGLLTKSWIVCGGFPTSREGNLSVT